MIEKAKTDAGRRQVDMRLDVVDELKAWRAEQDTADLDRFVFATASGKPRTRTTYPGRRGKLRVNYLHGAVNSIGSTSTRITLRGRRLGLGSRRLRSVLTHWTYLRCQGYVFGNGPSTTISFGPHGTVDVTVFSDRIGGCAAP